jgi:hypothetical protein
MVETHIHYGYQGASPNLKGMGLIFLVIVITSLGSTGGGDDDKTIIAPTTLFFCDIIIFPVIGIPYDRTNPYYTWQLP